MRNLIKDQKGSVLVITAVIMVVILGFAALAIDGGHMYYQKSHLQSAADAAALAGALSLPDKDNIGIKTIVDQYANANLKNVATVEVIDPAGNRTKNIVEVKITQSAPKFFAGFLTSDDYSISASAKAEYIGGWNGEGLPFINLNDDYTGDGKQITLHEKTGPGDFELMYYHKNKSDSEVDIENIDDPDKVSIVINYKDGITLDKGEIDNDVETALGYVLNRTKILYVFSLSAEAIAAGEASVIDKHLEKKMREIDKFEPSDTIVADDLVLLKIEVNSYDDQHDIMIATVLDVYDIANNELPPDFVGGGGSSGSSKLILIED